MIKTAPRAEVATLPKSRTGITGLDEITGGGLPRGRPTLVSGGAGFEIVDIAQHLTLAEGE